MGNLPPGTGPVGLVGMEPPVELPDEWPAMSVTAKERLINYYTKGDFV